MTSGHSQRRIRSSSGMTLVEFMIAITIGLFLILVVSLLYASASRATRSNDVVGTMNSDVRIAIDELSRSLRSIGYYGCLQPGGIVRNRINGSAYAYDFNSSLRAHSGTGSAFSPVLEADSPVPATVDKNSDVLVVRGGIGAMPVVAPFPATGTADVRVAVPTFPITIATGDFAAITDCGSATLFQATNVSAAGGDRVLKHATAGSPGNTSADLGRGFFGASEVIPIHTATYYVAPGVNGRNSLWRIIGTGTPEEIVSGVLRMRLMFGVDSNADRGADIWYTAQNLAACGGACAIGRWSNTLAVQINLVMESQQDNVASTYAPYRFMGSTITPTDKRLHRYYSAIVNVRNRTL